MQSIGIVSIVGARPQFVKLAAVERAIAKVAIARTEKVRTTTVHTGQHYDDKMSRVFFDELSIQPPAVNLAVGSGSQGQQTGKMLAAIEQYLLQNKPDVVVVYGDTNSTLAGALAAVKLHIPVAHVEAGLRSFNRRMPEEINRVMTDHVSDLLLAPTTTAVANLEREGLGVQTCYTGDVMYDAVLHHSELARRDSTVLERLQLPSGGYALATIHRAENTDPARLQKLLDQLNAICDAYCPVLFPVHPRTRSVMELDLSGWLPHPRLRLVEPLGYMDLLRSLHGARFVITDSGGLQKEAAFMARQCFTLRNETEWTETVELGANVLVGSEGERLTEAVSRHLRQDDQSQLAVERIGSIYGNGRAGEAVADALLQLVSERPQSAS